MPVDVTRPAKAYKLWDADDYKALEDDHAAVGWVCQRTAALVNGVVSTTVLLQNNATEKVKPAELGQVIVSDLTNVEPLSVAAYNQLYPDSQITPPEGN